MKVTLSKSKRGTMTDMFFVIGAVIAIVVMVMMGIKIWNAMRTTPIFVNTVPGITGIAGSTGVAMQQSGDRLNNGWDGFLIFLITTLFLTPIVAGFLIGSHPAFMWISVVLGIIVVFIGAIANNVYDAFISNSAMSDVAAVLPKTTYVFNHFGTFISLYIGLLLLALYFGFRSGK